MVKHFADEASSLVIDYLRACSLLNSDLSLDEAQKVLHIKNAPQDKVAVLSGGGSGHEVSTRLFYNADSSPLVSLDLSCMASDPRDHSLTRYTDAAFVGDGLLTAAVAGNIFASPNASQVRRALSLVRSEKGTLVILKRYTGDRLQFGLAAEDVGVNVQFILVGDDVSVSRSQGGSVGRRGLAGVVLVYKVAGALAKNGTSLTETHRLAALVAENLATVGSAFDHCHVPGTATEGGGLGEDQLELGLGIHNESGIAKIAIPTKRELVERMLAFILDQSDADRAFVPFAMDGTDEVIVLLNNLGGMSVLEFIGVVPHILALLAEHKIKPVRILCGTFVTSLSMTGFSITLLRLPSGNDGQKIIQALDEPSVATGWTFKSLAPSLAVANTPAPPPDPQVQPSGLCAPRPELFCSAFRSAIQSVISAEPDITRYDVIAGDGDCGLTLKAGAQAVLSRLDSGDIWGDDIVKSFREVLTAIEESMGGTSGALYAIFFAAFVKSLSSIPSPGHITPPDWVAALQSALTVLCRYTSARPPSRTLMDPLFAFINRLAESNGSDLAGAVESSRQAAIATATIVASSGRAAYVDQENLRKEKVPDPGAWGLVQLFSGIQSKVSRA